MFMVVMHFAIKVIGAAYDEKGSCD